MIEPAFPDPPLPLPAPEPDPEPAFTVHLERVFHGPLDLLLQLVRDQELEIHLVSLAQVCDAYCRHVRGLRQIDVDEAADYLVVAATLLAVKSRSLLPQEEIQAEDDPFEPGAELVQQLLLYKSLREAAEALGACAERRARLLPAGGRFLGRSEPEDAEERKWDLGDVSLWDLLQVLRRLEEETGFSRPHRVRPAGRPLREYVQDVWEQVTQLDVLSLHHLLQERGAVREDAAYYLVALLELARQKAIDLKQDHPFGDVEIRRSRERGIVDLGAVEQDFPPPPPAPEAEVDELLGSA